ASRITASFRRLLPTRLTATTGTDPLSVVAPHSDQVGDCFGKLVEGGGRSLAFENVTPSGVELEQKLALLCVPDVAAHPTDRCKTLSAHHRRYAMKGRCRVDDGGAGWKLDRILAGWGRDDQLTT